MSVKYNLKQTVKTLDFEEITNNKFAFYQEIIEELFIKNKIDKDEKDALDEFFQDGNMDILRKYSINIFVDYVGNKLDMGETLILMPENATVLVLDKYENNNWLKQEAKGQGNIVLTNNDKQECIKELKNFIEDMFMHFPFGVNVSYAIMAGEKSYNENGEEWNLMEKKHIYNEYIENGGRKYFEDISSFVSYGLNHITHVLNLVDFNFNLLSKKMSNYNDYNASEQYLLFYERAGVKEKKKWFKENINNIDLDEIKLKEGFIQKLLMDGLFLELYDNNKDFKTICNNIIKIFEEGFVKYDYFEKKYNQKNIKEAIDELITERVYKVYNETGEDLLIDINDYNEEDTLNILFERMKIKNGQRNFNDELIINKKSNYVEVVLPCDFYIHLDRKKEFNYLLNKFIYIEKEDSTIKENSLEQYLIRIKMDNNLDLDEEYIKIQIKNMLNEIFPVDEEEYLDEEEMSVIFGKYIRDFKLNLMMNDKKENHYKKNKI